MLSQRHILTFTFFLALVLLSSHSNKSQVSAATTYTVTDLDQTGSQFICQALIWTASNLKSGLTYSTCGTSVYILGGYNILGSSFFGASNGDYYQRIYSDLPTHNLIQYSFSLYALDNWSSNILSQSLLKVSFDGTVMTSVALDNSAFSTNTCGASYKDLTTVKIYGIMKHSATTSMTLQILHYLNQDSSTASIGIRDLSMNFATVTTGIYTNLICGYASGITFYSGKCVCPAGQYNTTTTGGCTTCDISCASCYGAGSNQCYTCATGYSFNGQQCVKCDSSCSVCYGTSYSSCTICAPGYWLLNGTTCIPSCDYPLIQNVTGTQITCNSPCPTSQNLYWDGTCSSSCASPLKTNTLWSTIPTCNWNCSSTTDYLYWNGTCNSACASPLTTVISHSRRFCTDTCSQYLYWNGSCISGCSSPLSSRSEGGKNFCDFPCAAYQYLYWNGSCLNNCSSPYSSRLEGGYQFCDYSCAATGQFLYFNGSCLSTCTSPLTTRTEASRQYCDYSCEKAQYLYWNGSCLNTCAYPLSIRIDAERQFCDYTCAVTGQYLYWNGLCLSSCNYPLSTRTEASRQYCDYSCEKSQYLYWNGSCLNNCSSPLSVRIDNSRQFCDFPCPGQYLYWNGTCNSNCVSPLNQRTDLSGNKYCDYLCETTQYLYWNGSCLNNCSSPLSARTEANRLYCDYLCATTGQFLYWNGSCKTTCSSPLSTRTEASRQYCDYSCDITQYLYWNGTCSNDCDSPLTIRTEASRQYCDYSCSTSQYLYWNGSCKSTCSYPLTNYTISGNLYCDYPCYLDQYLYWNGSCISNCSFPLSARTEANSLYCDFGCTGSQFLYWNGTCSTNCVSPLSQRTDTAGKKYCDYSCEISQYLYWNGTCVNICGSPLTTRTEANRQYCDYSCPISSQYLYWNGSCLSSCSSPLTSTTINTKKYCYYSCEITQYLYWNGTCLNDCDSPLSTRIDAGRQYCDFPCSSSQYLYWNGTCSATCSSPLSQRTDSAGKKYCDYSCEITQYLYWNGTCLNTCTSPLTTRTEANRQYCDYSCPSTSQYLYWNGTCASTCSFPLTTRTEGSKKFCSYSCCSSEYLYWNGTCASTCSSPLASRTEAGQLYCDFACTTSTNFLYWNGTCSSSCSSPLVSLTQGTVQSRKFCNSPCGSYNYLYSNGSCLSTCPDPYYSLTVGGIRYCYSPCLSTEYLIWDGSCITSCPSPMKKVTYDYGKACIGPCNSELEYYHTDTLTCDTTCSSVSSIILSLYLTCSPNGTVVVTPTPTPNKTVQINNITENTVVIIGKTELVGMLKYLYFLDITYPPSLESISVSKGRNILSPRLVLEMSSSLANKLPEVTLPGVFDSRDMKSNFFVNFWDEFMLILIILVIAVLFWIGQKTAEKRGSEKIRLACARMNILLKWNIFFVIFATNMGNIILYVGLQFMSLDTSSGLGVFSFGMCCILLVMIVAFFAGTVSLIKRRRSIKVTPLVVIKMTSSTSTESEESNSEYPSLQVLYRGFKEDRFGSYFYPIYTFRSVLPLLLTLFFYQSPLVQIVLQIPIGLVMIALIVIKKPIISRLSHIELIIQETIVLVVNFAAIGIVVMSDQGKADSTFADFLGEIIIRGSQAINWTVIVFLAIRVTLEAQEIQRLRETKYSNDKTVWIHLLCHFVQQGGFGFEKLTILNLPSYKPPLRSPKSGISVPKLFTEERTLSTTNPLSVTIPTHAPATKTMNEDDEADSPRIFGVDSEILAGSENRALPRFRRATRDKNCASFLMRPERSSFIAPDANSSILKSLPTKGRGSIMQNFANDSFTENSESPTSRSNTADNPTIKLQSVEQTNSSRLFTPLVEPTSSSRLWTPAESTKNLLLPEPENNNYKGRVHRRSIFGVGGDFGTRNNLQSEDEQGGDQTTRSLRNEINMKFEVSESPIFKRPRLSMKPDENKFGSLNFEGLDVTNKSLSVIDENGTPKVQHQYQPFDTPKSETPMTSEFSLREG